MKKNKFEGFEEFEEFEKIQNLKDMYGFCGNYYQKRFIEVYQERPEKDIIKFKKFKKEYKKNIYKTAKRVMNQK